MDVVFVGVLVAHGHPWRGVLVKAHALHEVARHGLPLVGAQALAGGQRQGAVPDGFFNVGAQLAHGGKLLRKLAGAVSGHVASDTLRIFIVGGFASDIKNIFQRAAKATASANFGFHFRCHRCCV